MRSFEERKKEILCRSQQRIQARRHMRKRIIMTCVPLVLCVAALSVWAFSDGFAIAANDSSMENISENSGTYTQAMDSIADSDAVASCTLLSIQVSRGAEKRTYTDKKTLDVVSTLVQIPETWFESESESTADVISPQQMKDWGYTLTLTDSTGTETKYLLIGAYLIEDSSGVSRTLDDTQLVTLRELLELEEIAP